MPISERYIDPSDPEYLASQLRATPPLPRKHTKPNEMPAAYAALSPRRDLLPLRARRDQDLRMVANVDHEIEQNNARMDRARSTLERTASWSAEAEALTEKIRKAEIRAFLAETEPASTEAQDQLSLLLKLIADAEATRVIELLKTKNEELRARRGKLQQNLARSTEDWLRAKHANLVEDFRRRLHDLHDGLAAIIAVEEHPDFNRHDPKQGWNLVAHLGGAVRYDSPFRPAWFNVAQVSVFPGFAAATGALHAELFDEEVGL
ncbi:hypothetical protein GFL85_10560 [Rhizobium laguerreae]|uniref:hypothetical protein n=1 Tax=Rhizobium laguerreae TaxID=1076926 RepID=UPI00143F68EA|nr:hypothetical protein [Rhizobium laguerreae]NKM11473.1 hypothetical protein [Rhizobium laguerreae]